MIALHVFVFPLLSITVKTTVLTPIFAQVKLFGATLNPAKPHASLEPLLISATVTAAFPAGFNASVKLLHNAVGGVTSWIVIVDVQVETFELLSVTVKVAVLAPIFAQVYAWLAPPFI